MTVEMLGGGGEYAVVENEERTLCLCVLCAFRESLAKYGGSLIFYH